MTLNIDARILVCSLKHFCFLLQWL